MPAKSSFRKRIYTLPAFRADVQRVFDHPDGLRRAFRSGRVSRAFAEKLMLVVTAVNGCRYCRYGHSLAALSAGVSQAELQKILSLDLGDFPAEEASALAFAQHFAEANGQPDPAAWQRLAADYGPEAAGDILVFLRMITLGNLIGNTFDALLARIAGRPAPGSSLGNELSVLLGVFWLPPARLILRLFRPAAPASTGG